MYESELQTQDIDKHISDRLLEIRRLAFLRQSVAIQDLQKMPTLVDHEPDRPKEVRA